MECNKDEATRAKDIAERKFSAKDMVGARKFALKAQALFPGLEGIPQLLSTLEVYISAENKINGEADWYGILGVDQKADEETVRKQYRKLALMLHPDKNKSIGADGAFKLISEAWTLLSDKAKRMAYDQKRNVKTQQKAKFSTNPGKGGGSSAAVPPPGTKGYNSTKAAKPPKSSVARAAPAPTHHKPKPNTFWTVCHGCKMQYEYLRVYLNHNLLCPNCHEPFLAKETAPPSSNGSKSSSSATWNFSQKRQSSSKQTSSKKAKSSTAQDNFQWSPFSRTSGGASSAAQAASMVQQAYEKVKREREEAEATARKEEALRKRYHSSKRGTSSADQPNAGKRRKGTDDVAAGDSGWNFVYEIGVKVGGTDNGSATKDFSRVDMQNSLIEKARKEIQKKLDEWRTVDVPKQTEMEGIEKSPRNSDDDRSNSREPNDTKVAKVETETMEAMSINVPDPDFHDFDKDRTEMSFENNQIWATYDGDDGMPRYYALIHSVISTNPFRMRVAWLNSKTNSELGLLNWVASGFSKTCGDFRVGRYEINSSLNSFSHKVRWSKGPKGLIRIYPRKGEVWALYRNWSPDWNEVTPDEVIHKYDMVEVVEDYTEELGVAVTPLVKVAGFKTVFHRHLDHRQVRRIPRDEMFRFSHHVPSYVLTGQEAPNAPKGCRELDPAATPSELLQVIPDFKEEEEEEESKSTKKMEEKVVDSVVVDDDSDDVEQQ